MAAAKTEKSAPKASAKPKAEKSASASSVGKKTITLRLARGTIACTPDQRACVRGLGLRHREHVKTLENTPSVRGMIKKVLHLVEIVSETR